MTSVKLSAPAFAYLLATVEASDVVGLDDPDLFPEDEKTQEKVYQEGLDRLIQDGWITPSAENEEVYDFDPLIYEMAAIIGAPESVIATMYRIDAESYLNLYYLWQDQIIQLSPLDEDEYSIGIVDTLDQLTEKVPEALGIIEPTEKFEIAIPVEVFDQLQESRDKFKKGLRDSLVEADLDENAIGSLEDAFTSGEQGEIVIAAMETGEVDRGRRGWLYGSENNNWFFYLDPADMKQVIGESCSPAEIQNWLVENLNALQN